MFRTILLLAAAVSPLAAPLLAHAQPPAPIAADSKAGQRAMGDPDVVTVRNVTRAEIVHGLPLVDDDGMSVGMVERLAGNDVIVSDGTAEYRVPITQIYAFNRDGAEQFASRTPKTKMTPEPAAPQAAKGN